LQAPKSFDAVCA